MKSKKEIKSLMSPLIVVLAVSFLFSVVSFTKPAIGKEYGYHKGGQVWQKYKKYRKKYNKESNRKIFYKLRYLKKSKNPVVSQVFWDMRKVYLAHKLDTPEMLSKLPLATQEKFRKYKKYHGYKKYRDYREKAY